MIHEFYEKLAGRQRILFIAAVVFFVLALMDRIVLGPIMEQLKVQDSDILAKHDALQRNLRVISFRDSILKEYSKYEVYLDSGNKSQEEIIAALLKMIESLAGQNDIKISNIQPGDVEVNPLYKEYLTTIDCEGSMTSMIAFMDALEASDFLFRIMSYSLEPKTKTGEMIKANIHISRILIAAEKLSETQGDMQGAEGVLL